MLTERSITCDIGTGWVSDVELARRLAEADIYYLPQHDYDHWNNSGTARLVMNFGRPVIVPPHNAYLDLRDFVIFVEDHDVPAVIAWMRDSSAYEAVCQRSRRYAAKHAMRTEMPALALFLHEAVASAAAANHLGPNAFSALHLIKAEPEHAAARLTFLANDARVPEPGAPGSDARLAAIEAVRRSAPDARGTT